MKRLFDVTIHNAKNRDKSKKSVVAANDLAARAQAVSKYVASWNKPYRDDETGKIVKPPQVSEKDVWCEIEFVREID